MDGLPSRFNPAELARSGQHFSFTLAVTHFKRFCELLASGHGEVVAAVTFGLDGSQPVAKGTLKTVVELPCQRCLEPVMKEINANFACGFVRSEADADALSAELDPVLVDETEETSAVEFLEDELILQIPARVVHADEQQCNAVVIEAVSSDTTTDNNRHHPFSDLGDLLKN